MRVGMEASGHARWFERLLAELQFELWMGDALLKFYRGVVRIWWKWLNRRTRGNRMTWERYTELLRRHPLLPPRICHVWT